MAFPPQEFELLSSIEDTVVCFNLLKRLQLNFFFFNRDFEGGEHVQKKSTERGCGGRGRLSHLNLRFYRIEAKVVNKQTNLLH